MRLFLAINFPADVRGAIVAETAPLRAAAPDVKWVGAEQLHLTLKFLGEQPAAMVDRLRDAMGGIAERHTVLPVTVGGVGAFPKFRRARVVWIGVEPTPRLELLHHDVELACADLGFELEGRAFRPHITLGRLRDGEAEETLRALARAAKRVAFREDVDVEAIDLMSSQLTPGGARYDLVASAALREV